jgi:uncharacterized protein YukJ
LPYGFLKGQVSAGPHLQWKKQHNHEIQYHLHFSILVDGNPWEVAVNVGTNDDDDLLMYKLVFDFHHPLTQTLAAAASGQNVLTGQSASPGLDFVRDPGIFQETSDWTHSEKMDGSDAVQPVASMKRLLSQAFASGWTVYVFGRFFDDGDGVHDVHMNQGSSGEHFFNDGAEPRPPHWDGNDVWQDGALFVDRGEQGFAAYFARFTKQSTDTDQRGNPKP